MTASTYTPIHRIHILHGPNMNLLGKRDLPSYNRIGFKHYYHYLTERFPETALSYMQTNHEGVMLDKLHLIGYENHSAILLNAAAWTHTSMAIGDAVASIDVPVVDIHLTDIYARGGHRSTNFIAPHAWMSITGYGLPGYERACQLLLSRHLM